MAQDEISPNSAGDQEAVVATPTLESMVEAMSQVSKPEVPEVEPEVEAEDQQDAETKAEQETPDEPEESEETTEETEETSDEENVLSHEIDLDAIPSEERLDTVQSLWDVLSDEDKKEFMTGTGSKLGKEMGKLRQRTKEAEERAEQAESKLTKAVEQVISPNNPFAGVINQDEVKEKEKEIRENRKFLVQKLAESTDLEFDIGEKTYSRSDLTHLLNYWDNQGEQLNEHKGRLRELRDNKRNIEASQEKLKAEYDWYGDKSSAERKEYNKVMEEFDFETLKFTNPLAASKLPELVARSINGIQPKAARSKIPVKSKRKAVGSTGSSGAPGKTSAESKRRKAISDRIFSGDNVKDNFMAALENTTTLK